MQYRIQETILFYQTKRLEAWMNGDRSWLWEGLYLPSDVDNQPSYHFGEYYVLDHYCREGWSGTRWYALGEWEPNNPKYVAGREMIASVFNKESLARIRDVRRDINKGEPDIFLYRSDGAARFIEVKKAADRIAPEQLTCMAHIKSILGAEVDIVYLAPEGKTYTPKIYELDLKAFTGLQVG
jgi:hypothetical protein